MFAYGVSGRAQSAVYVAVGGALAESVYAFLAFWGLTKLLDQYPSIIPDSRGVGAVLLFALGLAFVLHREKPGEKREPKTGWGGSFVLGFTLTALNPTLIVTWTAAATTLFSTGLLPHTSLSSALPFAVGAFVGIVSWFVVLLLILRRYKQRFERATLSKVVRGVGFALIGLSLWFAVQFARYLAARAG